LHSFSHFILNITRICWSTAFLQLLNFVCLLEFGRFTAFSLPAPFFKKIFVFAKFFAKFHYFCIFCKLFSRQAKTNFRENTKTKICVSTLGLKNIQHKQNRLVFHHLYAALIYLYCTRD
jgi:hypothetical protein